MINNLMAFPKIKPDFILIKEIIKNRIIVSPINIGFFRYFSNISNLLLTITPSIKYI